MYLVSGSEEDCDDTLSSTFSANDAGDVSEANITSALQLPTTCATPCKSSLLWYHNQGTPSEGRSELTSRITNEGLACTDHSLLQLRGRKAIAVNVPCGPERQEKKKNAISVHKCMQKSQHL